MRRRLIISICFLTMFAMIYACQSESEMEYTSYLSNGQELYKTNCMNCHGAKGEGLGELAPPLTDSVFIKEYKSKLACFIKNGANEPVKINGKIYQGKMPAFPQLEDIDIAQIIVYVSNSFGYQQGMYSYQQVNADLKACP
jgi:mono/diheme cytochrome c family protein